VGNVAALGMTMMMIVRTGAKMMIKPPKEIRRGDSLIVDYKEIKLEKFDSEPVVLEAAKILKEHFPMVDSFKIFKHYDYRGRYKIDLIFKTPVLNHVGHRLFGINIQFSGLSKIIGDENEIWEEVKPKE